MTEVSRESKAAAQCPDGWQWSMFAEGLDIPPPEEGRSGGTP